MAGWEHHLRRWSDAGLIDPAAAGRIRAHETEREKAGGLRWPVLLAIGLGGLLLGAGALLFVAAHWEKIPPGTRFSLVLALTALFHVAGALAGGRFSALASALHAVGTVCLGAGIFLAAQIFHLQEHWPGGAMLWALGAWMAWALLRSWPQAALAALLTPIWLGGEWWEATRDTAGHDRILAEGMLSLALTYLTALMPGKESPARKALAWIGGLAILPCAMAVVFSGPYYVGQLDQPLGLRVLGWTFALAAPLLLAFGLRRRAAWMNAVAALWIVALGVTSRHEAAGYALCAVGSVGLIAWGLREARRERVNLGVAGFALTLLAFYFSTVMDKLGRSASLVGLGFLFLLGGWLLEKTRRNLTARIGRGT